MKREKERYEELKVTKMRLTQSMEELESKLMKISSTSSDKEKTLKKEWTEEKARLEAAEEKARENYQDMIVEYEKEKDLQAEAHKTIRTMQMTAQELEAELKMERIKVSEAEDKYN